MPFPAADCRSGRGDVPAIERFSSLLARPHRRQVRKVQLASAGLLTTRRGESCQRAIHRAFSRTPLPADVWRSFLELVTSARPRCRRHQEGFEAEGGSVEIGRRSFEVIQQLSSCASMSTRQKVTHIAATNADSEAAEGRFRAPSSAHPEASAAIRCPLSVRCLENNTSSERAASGRRTNAWDDRLTPSAGRADRWLASSRAVIDSDLEYERRQRCGARSLQEPSLR